MSAAPKLVPTQISQPRLEPSDILTPEQLADRLQVPQSWPYKQVEKRGANCIPVLRCGRYLRFDWNAVCEWLRGKE